MPSLHALASIVVQRIVAASILIDFQAQWRAGIDLMVRTMEEADNYGARGVGA